ncbi:TIGR01440 family protein [Exiguobacterium sp. SL-9]|uniref:TIGR01440 family protein n=1 Tax=Exiguobacterium sp. SL-9 TaxID=2510963 RepID=UPI001040163B|nr:TIGR01440 family protein [Exiguobacterium sp. SL-9]TCI21745.1 TIGR01440 family protein [Exiguobacterium sp. SL-9]
MTAMKAELLNLLTELHERFPLDEEKILVIGCSTSEVVGKTIGKAGSIDVASDFIEAFLTFRDKTGVHLAFQGCEHINRALTVERRTQKQFGLTEVTVVPVRAAGGAMAEKAYESFEAPCVVESIQADAGIDIGSTLIGMHLKPVAIPVRLSAKQLGEAYVTFAVTRPKLIGGPRAHYPAK